MSGEQTPKRKLDLATAISLAALVVSLIGPTAGVLIGLKLTEYRVGRAEEDLKMRAAAEAAITVTLSEINIRLARIEGRLSGAGHNGG